MRGSPTRTARRNRIVVLLILLASALAALKIDHRAWPIELFARDVAEHFQRPNITWRTASPAAEGMSAQALDVMQRGLARHKTTALLVVRGGRLVYEWYPLRAGPNEEHYTAALAKAVIGSMTLLAALTEGRLRLDDPAWKYIPQWKNDPVRSRIRIRDLAFHTSGLADVNFFKGQDNKLHGWRAVYYRHPAERFRMAIDRVPILFTPGTRYRYSGIGYYALAYAVTESLRGGPDPDIRSLLRDRVMRPLGIPQGDWQISYATSYRADGMTLYAMGSGGKLTARAEARIGELLLDHGRWNGRAILSPYWVAQLLRGAGVPADIPSPAHKPQPIPSGGWWLNTDGAWPSLPRDAIVGKGAGHQTLLVVPSLDLVVVRQGRSLAGHDLAPARYREAADRWIFRPVMAAITGSSVRPAKPETAPHDAPPGTQPRWPNRPRSLTSAATGSGTIRSQAGSPSRMRSSTSRPEMDRQAVSTSSSPSMKPFSSR